VPKEHVELTVRFQLTSESVRTQRMFGIDGAFPADAWGSVGAPPLYRQFIGMCGRCWKNQYGAQSSTSPKVLPLPVQRAKVVAWSKQNMQWSAQTVLLQSI